MTDSELQDALDGLHAYDVGATDSGIHDEKLRARCVKELHLQCGENEMYPRILVGRIIRNLYLTEDALAMGYGPEDVTGLLEWLTDQMER